jgi:light-regulated signal transduction histidine kinase (bacteriophytochrome)
MKEAEVYKDFQKLENRVNELETLINILGHDLREPIRMLTSYQQLLIRRLDPSILEEQKDAFDTLVFSSRKMESMVQGMLSYSRVSTQNLEEVDIKLDSLSQEVQSIFSVCKNLITKELNLKNDTFEKVSFEVSTNGVSFSMNESKLIFIIKELIQNALRLYSLNEKPDLLKFSFEEKNRQFSLTYEDNGTGVPEHGIDRLGTLFYTVERTTDPSHIGAGLALIKRITEYHDGEFCPSSKGGLKLELKNLRSRLKE